MNSEALESSNSATPLDDESLASDPSLPGIDAGLAAALTDLVALAPELLKQALSVPVRIRLGEILYALNQYIHARRCFEQALSEDPANPDAANNLGVLQNLLNEPDAATHTLIAGLRENPADSNLLENLFAIFRQRPELLHARSQITAAFARRQRRGARTPMPANEQRATIDYAIYMTPRSGSSWLTGMLSRTDMLGDPREWFNPNGVLAETLKILPCFDIDDYVATIRREFCSPNTVFGFEIDYFRLLELILQERRPEVLFGHGLRHVYLTRRDIVAQAISLYRAVESDYWDTVRGTEETKARVGKVLYDADKIAFWITHVVDQERGFERYFTSYGIEPLRIVYEELVSDPRREIGRIADLIGISLANDELVLDVGYKKIGDAVNESWAERFSAERNEFLSDLAHARNQSSRGDATRSPINVKGLVAMPVSTTGRASQ